MKSRYVRSFAIAALMALAPLPVAAQSQLVDLGVATAYALNNAGQVALSTGIYTNGTTTPFPALQGQTSPAVGVAINNAGQVAGYAFAGYVAVPTPPGGSDSTSPVSVPVEFSDGTLAELQSTEGYATGINSVGDIVGYSVVEDIGSANINQGYAYYGFIYVNGKEIGVPSSGVFPGVNMPHGINDSGLVTGEVTVEDPNTLQNVRHAYIYNSSSGTVTDLGPGAGIAINAAGQVTGNLNVINSSNYDTIVSSSGFLYSNGTVTNLGGGRTGNAINSTGQVVGSPAFFYNGVTTDLNSQISSSDPLKLYVTLNSAVGINDSMLILVNGVDSRTNLTHAYLYQGPFFQIVPGSLNFTQTVGGTSPGLSVTVTNTGTAAIPFGLPYVNGNFSGRADSCGTSLAAGAQCRVTVVFVPKVAGVVTGELTIPSAGANYQVPLSGVAPISARISASSSAATVGQPLTLSWTVSAGSTCAASSYSTNTAWTASNPPFTGSVPVSGKQTLTEIVNGTVLNGTVTYTLNCTAPGVAAVTASTSVVWTWPPVTATISASPTTITAGQSTTLTWKSSNATSCTATGGGADDNWAGTKATSGSQPVTEPVALDTSSVVLTFGVTCNSTISGLSHKASVDVTEGQTVANDVGPPPSSGGGGGGVLNPLSLAFLSGILALRRVRGALQDHS